MFKIQVTLLLDVTSDSEACDAANEILREQQRSFQDPVGLDNCSALIDYAVGDVEHVDLDPSTYEEGDAF
jgi:hypothetical protein